MPAEPFDPFAPPRAAGARVGTLGRGRGRWWWEGVGRAVAVIVGFSLVADPTSMPGIETVLGQAIGGYVLARGVGLVLLASGFLPWRWSGMEGNRVNRGVEAADVEEL